MDVKEAEEYIRIMLRDKDIPAGAKTISYVYAKEAIETVLSELEEYEKTLDIFDERKYRKKYLEEERAKRPNLLYPDADEIYERYFQQRAELEKKDEIINEMAECIGRDIRCVRPEIECNKMTHDCRECVKEYFTKKCEGK